MISVATHVLVKQGGAGGATPPAFHSKIFPIHKYFFKM